MRSGRPVSRRAVLATLAAGATFGGVAVPSTTGEATAAERDSTLQVRVYPGPVPLHVAGRYGWFGVRSGWPAPFLDALAAVENAMDQLTAYAAEHSALEDVDASVEPAAPVEFSRLSAGSVRDALAPSRQTVLDAFHEQLHERGEITGSTCHLLLWWAPFNYAMGYGGTRSPTGQVGAVEGEGAQTLANVGATEVWDSRAVTRNLAIHETFHTFLDGDTTEEVIGSRCDHDLGSAVRTDDRTVRVSPMATAYSGPERIGGETFWHGTGCHDHAEFYRHDGYEDVRRWEHTTRLSEGTLEGATRYVERHFG